MLSEPEAITTPPTQHASQEDLWGMQYAIREARLGQEEGGVPIGGALFGADGTLIGSGRNQRVQKGSAILHGETDCLNNIGRQPASVFKGTTMFTTLSPCPMCTGAIILYGIKRVVMGENSTFVGGEATLVRHGVEVVNLDLEERKNMMKKFEQEHPDLWNEDIGED